MVISSFITNLGAQLVVDCLYSIPGPQHITMEMHPTLAACWYVAEATTAVEMSGATVIGADSICDEGLIFWTRHVTKVANTEAEQVTTTTRFKQKNEKKQDNKIVV